MGSVVSLTVRDICLYGQLSEPLNNQVEKIENSVQRYSTYSSRMAPLLEFIGEIHGFCSSIQKSRKALSAVSASFLFGLPSHLPSCIQEAHKALYPNDRATLWS